MNYGSVKPIRYIRDARLAERGDMIICQQQWAEVIGIRFHDEAPEDAPVMGPAAEVVTMRGSRWFGYAYYLKAQATAEANAHNSSGEVASE